MTSTVFGAAASARTRRIALPLPLRLALQDLRGGFSGLVIFLLCIALGTATIGTINGVGSAIRESLARQGKALLGGTIEATLVHRRADEKERHVLAAFGPMSEVATLRAMAQADHQNRQASADLKAVDGAYPLFGSVELDGADTLGQALFQQGGIAIDKGLSDQLDVAKGSVLTIGNASFPVTAILVSEPDRLAGGPTFGGRIMLSLAALEKTGLIQPGSLIRWSYRISADEKDIKTIRSEIANRLPQSGFLVKDSRDPSPAITSSLKRLTEFLTLAGLAAMLTGGIGVANGISAFIDKRRKTIAVFKAIGAGNALILQVFLVEIALVAALGIAMGLFLAWILPIAGAWFAQGMLPIDLKPGFQPRALALAGLFGVLATLPFILWPLGRTRLIRAAELFRNDTAASPLPPRAFQIASALAGLALAAAAIAFSEQKNIALIACAALVGIFAVFFAAGEGIKRLARALRRRKYARAGVGLALANAGDPEGLTRNVTLSMGAGLTLLTAVMLVDASLSRDLTARLPERAPSYFLLGIPKESIGAFNALMDEKAADFRVSTAPMLRGRLVALRGTPVEKLKLPANSEWVLNGDRGLTFSDEVPHGSEVVAGEWWPENYRGAPLVSFDADIAKLLGIVVGDRVTVNVLGRNLEVTVANLRKVQWATADINFFMIFSPNALAAAPFTYLATLSPYSAKDLTQDRETEVIKAISSEFPTVSAIRVKDALVAINSILEKVMLSVRIASGITLIMGALVVAGSIMTAQRRRIYEAVVLRSLGIGKKQIIAAHILEYLYIAMAVSALASIVGIGAAYLIVKPVMGMNFSLSFTSLLQPPILQTISILALGAAGMLRVLSAKPGQVLRRE